jgi:hypothetical protein
MTGLAIAGLIQMVLVFHQVIGVIQIQVSSIGLIDLMRIVLGVNIVLLIGLGYVWGRNVWRFRSKHTTGLFVFSILLLAENALAFYLFMFDPTLSTWVETASLVPRPAQITMLSIRVLELGGLLFLSWVTWD